MKFRTDFVTNSSSSSFVVKILFELNNGKKVSFSGEGYTDETGVIDYFTQNAIITVSPRQLGMAKDLEELIQLLANGVLDADWDGNGTKIFAQHSKVKSDCGNCTTRDPYNFIDKIRESVSSINDIKKITISSKESNTDDYVRNFYYNRLTNEYTCKIQGKEMNVAGSHGGDIRFDDADLAKGYKEYFKKLQKAEKAEAKKTAAKHKDSDPRLIESIKGVKDIFLYNGETVIVFDDKITIGDKTMPCPKGTCYVKGGVLYFEDYDSEKDNSTFFRYNGNEFVTDEFRYNNNEKYYSPNHSSSTLRKDDTMYISIKEFDQENITEIKFDKKIYFVDYDYKNEVIFIEQPRNNKYLFYSKTGELLWEYTQNEEYEYDERKVIIVDGIVVIPSSKEEYPHLDMLEGFDIKTGKKLWELTDDTRCITHYTVGPENMLYSLNFYHCSGHRIELHLYQLNPYTGEADVKVLKVGDHWNNISAYNNTIWGDKLYYFNGRYEDGCSFGVVDLNTKEVLVDIPMKLPEGIRSGTVVVTNNKVYVKIPKLLKIYDNNLVLKTDLFPDDGSKIILLEKKSGIKNYLWHNGEEVLVFDDKIVIGNRTLPSNTTGKYYEENGVLYLKESNPEADKPPVYRFENNKMVEVKVKTDQKRYRFDGNQFIKDEFKYDRQQYHSPHHSSSYEYINGRVCIQLKADDKEYAFDFESDKEYFILHYNCKHDILVLAFDKFTGYRFYSKTGSLIWEYKVKQGFVSDVEGVSFTDDIVIISSRDIEDHHTLEGFNIQTGEKLWESSNDDIFGEQYIDSHDNMMYALNSYRIMRPNTRLLYLYTLNPLTGETSKKCLEEGFHWADVYTGNTIKIGSHIYYLNTRTNDGCSLGKVDMRTQTVLQDIPLDIPGGYKPSSPIATDTTINVFIPELKEVRIYRKGKG